MKVDLKILDSANDLEIPQYATNGSAGVDLRAAISSDVTVAPGDRVLIQTGIQIALPVGYEGQIRPRSGLALNYGVTVLNTPGTVDSDYRGELKVLIINLGREPFVVTRGMRIAQLVISKFEQAEWNIVKSLDETSRGTNGYGSTGIK